MKKIYESTRNKNERIEPTQAILQGLSNDGGLFVLRNLEECFMDIKSLKDKNYFEIAEDILALFLDDFTKEEIKNCVKQAYTDKFENNEITPLIKLSDAYVLELFHGPTSAFKDVGLSMLSQLTATALQKTNANYDVLILTATSGDTGKAALEGFKDVENTKIMVFYPDNGVSKIQETQMKTQTGNNVKVCAINGNFDDAQNGVKELFVDEELKEELKKQNIQLSSANSINIGRLIPQIVYYFYAYASLLKKEEIVENEKVNFVVPTGNFGNILAGYYAKQIGLPINKLICASNDNNVLFDFINTGIYNREREFLKTISPSMDILISSNLERLLYYVSGCDNEYVQELMGELSSKGCYQVKKEVQETIQNNFICGYATNKETAMTIKKIYEKEQYVLDPHTAVAYKVLLDNLDTNHKNIVLATASPYKFTDSVYHSLFNENNEDEFALMKKLSQKTKLTIPENLVDLDKLPILHDDVIDKKAMKEYVLSKVKEI